MTEIDRFLHDRPNPSEDERLWCPYVEPLDCALTIIEKMDAVFLAVQNAESEPALRAAQQLCRDTGKDTERMLANRRYDDSERSDS